MKLNLKFAQRLFLCVAPLVTGSVFVALPGSAATLATSESTVRINNFSHNPLDASAFTYTNTYAFASVDKTQADNSAITPGSAQASGSAGALASFFTDSSPALTEAFNASLSKAQGDTQGEGGSYLGIAQSFSQVVGYNFSVGPNEVFSFDVNAALGLQTSTDGGDEMARASSNISFLLFDTTGITDPSQMDWSNPLEFINFSAQLDSSGQNYYSVGKSDNLNLKPTEVAFNVSSEEKTQSVFASLQGTISRSFDKLSSLVLIAVQGNEASVSCKAP